MLSLFFSSLILRRVSEKDTMGKFIPCKVGDLLGLVILTLTCKGPECPDHTPDQFHQDC